MNDLNPLRNPIDYVVVSKPNGTAIASPGIGTLYDADSKRKWDEVPVPGYTGSFARFMNLQLAHFRLECRLYSDVDWAAFKPFHEFMMQQPLRGRVPQGQKDTGTATGYFDISHPFLAAMGIKAAGVERIQQPAEIDNGGFLYTVHFIEWKGVPVQALAKPKAAAAPGPLSPHQKYIKEQNEEIQRQVKKLAAPRTP